MLGNTSALQHLTRVRDLLRMGYENEKQAFTELADRTGVQRLKERRYARFPIHVTRSYFNSLNRRIIELTVDADDSENDHVFEYGRPVVFFTVTGDAAAKLRRLYSGTVSFVDENRMAVSVPDDAEKLLMENSAMTGIMISFDETSYRTMFEALDKTMTAKGRLGELRDLMYSRQKAGELSFRPLGFPYLNIPQQETVNKVIAAKDVAVVPGPPGTTSKDTCNATASGAIQPPISRAPGCVLSTAWFTYAGNGSGHWVRTARPPHGSWAGYASSITSSMNATGPGWTSRRTGLNVRQCPGP